MQSFDRLIGLSTSVTRWLDCFFIFGHFQHMIICPMEFKICQSKLKKLPNTKSTLLKWPKFFNVMPEWRNLAKSITMLSTLPLSVFLSLLQNCFPWTSWVPPRSCFAPLVSCYSQHPQTHYRDTATEATKRQKPNVEISRTAHKDWKSC